MKVWEVITFNLVVLWLWDSCGVDGSEAHKGDDDCGKLHVDGEEIGWLV